MHSLIINADEDASDEDDDDDEDYEDDGELTTIESYTTTLDDDDCPVDEYQEFKNTLESVRMQDPNWFNILMASIDQHHQKNLQEISTLAQQRKDAYGMFGHIPILKNSFESWHGN